jgi:hypothetical protein
MLPGKVVISLLKTETSTSINSKWIKDLNIRPETLRLMQEGGGNTVIKRQGQ